MQITAQPKSKLVLILGNPDTSTQNILKLLLVLSYGEDSRFCSKCAGNKNQILETETLNKSWKTKEHSHPSSSSLGKSSLQFLSSNKLLRNVHLATQSTEDPGLPHKDTEKCSPVACLPWRNASREGQKAFAEQ